ncbi:acyl-CoA thioesterase [Archangium sp.]|uniref:acyl-CoA thioesterase n=1 Tax=Archangium sp. TaxID=1872627 RepID=UPI002D5C5135|nr:acyl-CoA thioesterase [Archangium sp.]HYO59323.1 acyl-CoA thioesterase [Archangium sp.]
MSEYSKSFEVKWADVDANRHMRHSVYGDYATHVRFSFMAEHGFDLARFGALQFGPVIFSDETQYRKEVTLGDVLRIDLQASGLSPSGARWRMRQNIYRQDGKLAAVHNISGGWLNLRERKLMPPPQELTELMAKLPRTEDFAELPE